MPQDLIPTVLHIPAGVGIDQKTRPELIQPGQANLYAKNVRLTKFGALTTRAGFTTQVPYRMDDSLPASGLSMFARRKETCKVSSDFRLDSYSYTLQRNATIGLVPELHCERFPVTSIGPSSLDGTLESIAVAYANGLYFVAAAHLDSGIPGVNAFYIITIWVVDRTTRQVVARIPAPFSASTFTAAMHLKMCSVGASVFCIVQQGANLKAFKMDATSYATLHAGASALVTLATDSTGDDFDCCGMETSFCLVYPNTSAATHRVTVKKFDAAMGLLATGTSITTNNHTTAAVAIDGSEADNVWVVWSDTLTGNTYKTIALSPADVSTIQGTVKTSTAGNTTPNRLGVRRVSSTDAYVVARQVTATTANWFMFYDEQLRVSGGAVVAVLSNNGVANNAGQLGGWTPYSQPFQLGSRTYAWAVNSNEPNGTSTATAPVGVMCCFDITKYNANFRRPVATPAAGLQSYTRDAFWSARKVVTVDGNTAATICVVKKNNVEASIDIVEVDNVNATRWQTAEHNGVTYMSSGQVYGYDGQQVFESSYVAPPSCRATDSGNAGNVNGAVSYVVIVEWTDAEGNVHWSEPSAPTTLTVANKQVNVVMLGFGHTAKDGQTELFNGTSPPLDGPFDGVRMRYKVYRTKNGGGEFFLVTSFAVLSGANQPQIVDNLTDTALGANEKLYTVPGTPNNVLFRRAPPSSVGLCDYQGMLLSITEDRKSVVTTGEQVLGEGAYWNPILQAPVGDELTAIREMDGVAYIWSRKGLFATSFEPPGESGGGGGIQFATIRRVTSEVGCTEPRSIVKTTHGFFFRSKRGIELLTRAGSIEWIGQKVQSLVSQYPIITSAVYVERDDTVIFTLATSESAGIAQSPGIRLVFDLSNGVWISADEGFNAGGVVAAAAQSAAVVYDGQGSYVYAWLDPAYYGYVHLERTDGVCTDVGAYFVEGLYETAWIKTGLQQEHQFWQGLLLYERASAAGLKVEVAYDWQDYASADDKLADEALIASSPSQIEIRPKARRQAFKLRVRTTAPAVLGTGAGLNFIGFSIDVAQHHGSTKSTPHLAATARI